MRLPARRLDTALGRRDGRIVRRADCARSRIERRADAGNWRCAAARARRSFPSRDRRALERPQHEWARRHRAWPGAACGNRQCKSDSHRTSPRPEEVVQGRGDQGQAGQEVHARLERKAPRALPDKADRTKHGKSASDHLGAADASRTSFASYYGPGLYGGGLACGGSLSPSTVGVAHKNCLAVRE